MQTPALDLARPWRTHPRETLGLGVLALLATMMAGVASSTERLPGLGEARATLPAPPDMSVRPVAPQTALQLNQEIPLYSGPNPAARPFSMVSANSDARARALECLTSAIYYEAGQEGAAGQLAVAQVVLNRVRHPAFPSSICGVVYEGSTRSTGCQFTFTCDGSMTRAPVPGLWNRARKVAEAALAGTVATSIGNATHYHANYVLPYWAPTLAKTAVIGTHIFYRWAGSWGKPASFVQGYAGREQDPRALRTAVLSVDRSAPVVTAAVKAVDDIPGTKVETDGKRVRVLFTPKAREVTDKVQVTPYVERVSASDNLRWTLGSTAPSTPEKAFGKAAAETEAAQPAS